MDGRRCAGCSSLLAADNTGRLCWHCHHDQQDQLATPPVNLGDDFWRTDAFIAAFESQHIGRVIKVYRNHPRHLQLRGRALSQDVLARWLGLNQGQISKLENGNPEENIEACRRYADILHIPREMLWFDFPGESRVRARISVPTAVDLVLSAGISSRSNRNGLLAAPSLDSLLGESSSSPQQLINARSHFERMYRSSGGLVAGARVEQFLARQALPLLASFGGSEADQARSQRAVGGLIALAGICAYDSEDWTAAEGHFKRALMVAQRSHDYGFKAYVLALMVNQALALENYKAAQTLAEAALDACSKAPPTALLVDLQVMRAKALASLGNKADAKLIVVGLESEFNKLSKDQSLAEASYVQEGHILAQLSEALSYLGDLDEAQRYAELSLSSEGHPRGKVNKLASLATLEVARGEIERASLLACEMVDSAQGMESRRLNSRFVRLRNELANSPTSVSRDALDRIDSAVRLIL